MEIRWAGLYQGLCSAWTLRSVNKSQRSCGHKGNIYNRKFLITAERSASIFMKSQINAHIDQRIINSAMHDIWQRGYISDRPSDLWPKGPPTKLCQCPVTGEKSSGPAKQSSEMKILLTNDLFAALLSLTGKSTTENYICIYFWNASRSKRKSKSPNDFG